MAKLKSQSERPRDHRRAPARWKKSQTVAAQRDSQSPSNVTTDPAKSGVPQGTTTPQSGRP